MAIPPDPKKWLHMAFHNAVFPILLLMPSIPIWGCKRSHWVIISGTLTHKIQSARKTCQKLVSYVSGLTESSSGCERIGLSQEILFLNPYEHNEDTSFGYHWLKDFLWAPLSKFNPLAKTFSKRKKKKGNHVMKEASQDHPAQVETCDCTTAKNKFSLLYVRT